jgi:hypothetical protein
VLGSQNASIPTREIQPFAECRDVTIGKGNNQTEKIDLR